MRLRHLVIVLATCSLLPMRGLAQDDATKAQAREQFNQGLSQYEASQYEAALESFQEAYRLSPHPLVRVNMANCYDRLSKPVEALFHFEHFLSETEGDSSRAAQRGEVQSAVRRLKKSVGELNVRVIPDGAMVRVDETEERRAPITEPVRLAAGDHTITVSRAGFDTRQERVQIRGGQSETLNITLSRQTVSAAPAAAPAPAPPVAAEEGAPVPAPVEAEPAPDAPPAEVIANVEPLPIAEGPRDESASNGIFTPPVIIAGVISGTLLIGSGLMAMAALKADADHDGYVAQSTNPALSDREQAAAARSAKSADNLTDSRTLAAEVLLAGALIAGAAAVIFVVTQEDGSDPEVALQLSPGGVGVRGTF